MGQSVFRLRRLQKVIMAVKVRCPTCEKVLSAPEAARGKAVKCPGCETKVKVPVGEASSSGAGNSTARKSSAKAPAKKAAAPESGEFLADLDLDKIVDSSQSMCPKCGASIPEDANECPQCGVDPNTGQLSASAKKRRSMKGPDPAEFYSVVWSDSWAFLKENIGVAVRTFLYNFLFWFLAGGCIILGIVLAVASGGLPPLVFMFAMAVMTTLVMPGWYWFVTIETIRTTVVKKKLSLGKVNFDLFQCMALGIKLILWSIVFSIFPPIPFAFIMFPLAMIHMAMPVTKRGWLNFLMLPTFFRNIGPTLYFWLILIVTAGPGLSAVGVVQYFYNKMLREIIETRGKPTFTSTQMVIVLLMAIVVPLLVQFVNSFLLLFNARVIGLIAYYFQNSLDLVTFIAEKEYTRKEIKLDRFGVPIKTSGQKAKEAALLIVIFLAICGAGFFIYYTQFKK
jgi:hypothetical protein